jgi:hypothetical protein
VWIHAHILAHRTYESRDNTSAILREFLLQNGVVPPVATHRNPRAFILRQASTYLAETWRSCVPLDLRRVPAPSRDKARWFGGEIFEDQSLKHLSGWARSGAVAPFAPKPACEGQNLTEFFTREGARGWPLKSARLSKRCLCEA